MLSIVIQSFDHDPADGLQPPHEPQVNLGSAAVGTVACACDLLLIATCLSAEVGDN